MHAYGIINLILGFFAIFTWYTCCFQVKIPAFNNVDDTPLDPLEYIRYCLQVTQVVQVLFGQVKAWKQGCSRKLSARMDTFPLMDYMRCYMGGCCSQTCIPLGKRTMARKLLLAQQGITDWDRGGAEACGRCKGSLLPGVLRTGQCRILRV